MSNNLSFADCHNSFGDTIAPLQTALNNENSDYSNLTGHYKTCSDTFQQAVYNCFSPKDNNNKAKCLKAAQDANRICSKADQERHTQIVGELNAKINNAKLKLFVCFELVEGPIV